MEALIGEAGGEGQMLARRLVDAGGDVTVVADRGIAAAAVVARLRVSIVFPTPPLLMVITPIFMPAPVQLCTVARVQECTDSG